MNDTIRLLYAEDNPLDADLTRVHFEREAPGFRLEVVGTGARCLARLAAEPFDLLLLDNHLPDMDGLDVLGRLRAAGQTLPVVLITGVGDDETVARALRAGAADYVPKSEGYLDTLPDLLRGVLARQRSGRLLGSDGAPRAQRILYVEHNPMDVELTASHFAAAAPHLQLHIASSSLQALSQLVPGNWFDLVLTDLRMPDMGALEFIREVRRRGIDLPFIVITGKGDEATAVAILRLGAYDYLVKRDNYLIQLPHAIDHALQRFHLDRAVHRLHAELESLNASLEQKVENRTAELLHEVEARQASEEKFRKITESAQDAIIVMGADGNILFWNLAAERIFGHTAAEAMGQALHALLTTQQVQAEFAQGFAHFQESGEGPIIGRVRELTALRKNGEEFPVEISVSAMQLKGKWHAIGILRDISERKRMENALRESEKRFRATFEQAAVGIAHVAPDGHWLGVNQRLCDIVGYTREELLAATFQDITHPDDLELDLNYVRQMLAGEIPVYSMEKRYFHKNGEIVWINLTVALVRRANGTPEYFISVVEDVTERKQAEKESHLMLAMGKTIAEAESFVSALDVSLRTICESTGWDYCEVWVPSHDGTYLELGEPYCCMDGGLEGFRSASREFKFASGIGLPGQAVASGKPVWIQNVTADANFLRAPLAKQAGIRAAVAIPILSGRASVAVMVFFMHKERAEDARTIALISAIATQLGTAFQRRRDADHIQQLANFDALTGLPNRVLLNDRISQSLSMAQRNREQLAVMFLDLDHFKNVNDTLGHRIGDGLLIEVAKRLKSVVREEDTVSRLGGDEFILVLPGTDVDGAARAAKKLLEVIGQPYRFEQHELIVTPSIGIAMYPADSEDFESLHKDADVAMYRAKADGRNGYCFFTQEMQAHTTRNMQLEYALRYALERNQLQLHYQPQVSLQGGAIVGAEALLRWQHPDLGMVSPAEFIPVAEASGQIMQIGEWVLRSAARQLRAWMDSGLAPMTVAVNLSAVQFRHARLPGLVMQILDEAKLPPQYLELELTESVAMGDPLAAIAVMRNMHERGIRMSIDDFGTGYSSLSYLKHFKIHRLKIDQSFVRDITEDPDDRAIVAAIISLASALGIQTIAEGVETEGQLAFLRENGCNEMQGYYYSRPLPADQFEAFVRKSG